MKPLYMWAGGKSKMIPKYVLSPGIPYSGYDTYIEPFFGGGAMMIHIHQNNPSVKRFILNDINSEIVNLYRVIKSDVEQFITFTNFLSDVYLALNKEKRKIFFYDTREKYITESEYKQWSPTQEAAVLYFLMKTAFNGIFQTTKKAKGRFATPAGLLNQTTHVYDENNVREWNIFLQKVDIYCGDYKTACDAVNKNETAFYFMDPPYRESYGYEQKFDDLNQINLIELCVEAVANGNKIMYCNRDTGDAFYDNHRSILDIEYYDVSYTAGRRSTNADGKKEAMKAREILLYGGINGIYDKT
jgi:DNA adenine methylase